MYKYIESFKRRKRIWIYVCVFGVIVITCVSCRMPGTWKLMEWDTVKCSINSSACKNSLNYFHIMKFVVCSQCISNSYCTVVHCTICLLSSCAFILRMVNRIRYDCINNDKCKWHCMWVVSVANNLHATVHCDIWRLSLVVGQWSWLISGHHFRQMIFASIHLSNIDRIDYILLIIYEYDVFWKFLNKIQMTFRSVFEWHFHSNENWSDWRK